MRYMYSKPKVKDCCLHDLYILLHRGTTDNGVPFREAFYMLGQLRSMTSAPFVAMSATVSASTKRHVQRALCLLHSCKEIIITKPKDNIR